MNNIKIYILGCTNTKNRIVRYVNFNFDTYAIVGVFANYVRIFDQA